MKAIRPVKARLILLVLSAYFFTPSLPHSLTSSLPEAFAGTLPSLFRGIVVADGLSGVRVVSVEEGSQAFLANVRAEDIILSIEGAPVGSIDEFAAYSLAVKGKAVRAELVVLRGGQPRSIELHLYSYPVLRRWGLRFVPAHDFRFAEPKTGREYWMRMGNGFEIARKPELAADAYLNALHNDPEHYEAALKASAMLAEAAHRRLEARQLAEALEIFEQQTQLLEGLFDQPLSEEQLRLVKSRLEQLLTDLRSYRSASG